MYIKGIKRGEYGAPTKMKFLWGENPLQNLSFPLMQGLHHARTTSPYYGELKRGEASLI